MAKSYTGDVGTVILLNCGSDISSATIKKIFVKQPDGTEIEWTIGIVIYQTNYLKYVVQENDFNQNGLYKLQSYIEMPSWKGRGETAEISISNKWG